MTKALRVMSLIGCALFTATAANAEYYHVGPSENNCSSPCCSCAASVDINKKVFHDHWYSKNKSNRYSIEEIRTTCVGPTYDSPRQSHYSFVKFNHAGDTSRKHFVNTSNDPYYPDMATADDEIMVDSDMNNQY